MWYFAWIQEYCLRLFGIINALWLEHTENMDRSLGDDHNLNCCIKTPASCGVLHKYFCEKIIFLN